MPRKKEQMRAERRRSMSLNDATIEAIKRGLGIMESEVEYDDLDDLIGTWKKDPLLIRHWRIRTRWTRT